MRIKSLYRSARELTQYEPDRTFSMYLVGCILDDSAKLNSVHSDPRVRVQAQQALSRIDAMLSLSCQIGVEEEVLFFLESLMDKIHELHNELERRDSFMRAYQEDFECPSTRQPIRKKVLYDEREWRSIKFIAASEIQADPHVFECATRNGFLPQRFNLTFQDADVVAILAEDEAAKVEIVNELRSGTTLLSASMVDKVYTVSNFAE